MPRPWEHQAWYEKYVLAVSETNPSKMLERIVEAQSAIMSRMIASETDTLQRDALEEALKVLSVLASAA
jgi:hypothetical protein